MKTLLTNNRKTSKTLVSRVEEVPEISAMVVEFTPNKQRRDAVNKSEMRLGTSGKLESAKLCLGRSQGFVIAGQMLTRYSKCGYGMEIADGGNGRVGVGFGVLGLASFNVMIRMTWGQKLDGEFNDRLLETVQKNGSRLHKRDRVRRYVAYTTLSVALVAAGIITGVLRNGNTSFGLSVCLGRSGVAGKVTVRLLLNGFLRGEIGRSQRLGRVGLREYSGSVLFSTMARVAASLFESTVMMNGGFGIGISNGLKPGKFWVDVPVMKMVCEKGGPCKGTLVDKSPFYSAVRKIQLIQEEHPSNVGNRQIISDIMKEARKELARRNEMRAVEAPNKKRAKPMSKVAAEIESARNSGGKGSNALVMKKIAEHSTIYHTSALGNGTNGEKDRGVADDLANKRNVRAHEVGSSVLFQSACGTTSMAKKGNAGENVGNTRAALTIPGFEKQNSGKLVHAIPRYGKLESQHGIDYVGVEVQNIQNRKQRQSLQTQSRSYQIKDITTLDLSNTVEKLGECRGRGPDKNLIFHADVEALAIENIPEKIEGRTRDTVIVDLSVPRSISSWEIRRMEIETEKAISENLGSKAILEKRVHEFSSNPNLCPKERGEIMTVTIVTKKTR